MPLIWRVAISALTICTLSQELAAAEAIPSRDAQEHCVAPETRARIAWSGVTGSALTRPRVYFRSADAKVENYVEMVRSGRLYAAVLPKAAATTRAIEYRVVTTVGERPITAAAGSIVIGKGCSADTLTQNEQRLAGALVIGTTAGAPAVPIGFQCDGIAGMITPRGELRAYAACSEALISAMAAAADGQTATTPSATVQLQAASKSGVPSRTTAVRTESAGTIVGPLHHRTPRRAPQPAQPPQPRLQEPVSNARP